jgi:multidrug efflux system membrane fusion protein
VDPGNTVHPTDANGIVVITQIEPIALLFSLPQDDLGSISEQMARGPLSVEVLSRDGSSALATGRVLLIDNRVDAQTGTIRLKAEIPNADRHLWPNQLALARLLLETRRSVLVVPDAAVQQGPEGSFVYVVTDRHAQMRPVVIERTEGELAIITSGLSDGDQVVIEGQGRLRPNAIVDTGDGHQRPSKVPRRPR